MRRTIKKVLYFFLGTVNFLKFYVLQRKKIKNSELVFFFPYYHTGGAERVHLNILQSLKEYKCSVIFTHLSATNNFYEQFKHRASIIELNSIRNKKSNYINNLLKKSISSAVNKSNSVKTVFGCNTNYYYEVLPYLNDSKKTIDLIHALAPNDDRRLMLSVSAKLLNFRVVINEKSKQDIINIYNEEKIDTQLIERIKVIGNGVDIDKNDLEEYKLKDFEKISIGFLGRWSEEKRPQIFLETAKRIKKQFPDVEFLMAGTGMKSNIDSINESGTKFLGEITNKEDLKSLYKKLNFVVISSVYEGFPMVIIESMIHGAIPICTDVGGIHEHITNMENGILIDDVNEEELIEAFIIELSYLIKNKDVIKKISNNAFNYSVENFSIDKFSQSYQKLFSL